MRGDPDPSRIEARRWWRYAEEDLALAEREQGRKDSLHRWVCVAAQQATEKALKAALVHEGIDFAKTHDLRRLWSAIPEGWQVRDIETDLDDLTAWSIAGRYPADAPEATPDDATRALSQAREVLAAVRYDLAERDTEETENDDSSQ